MSRFGKPRGSKIGKNIRQLQREKSVPAPTPLTSVELKWLLVGGILSGISLVWSYWPTIEEMVIQWLRQPDYSHGILVIPIAIFFLWSKRSQISSEDVKPSIYGLLLLLIGAFLRIAAGAFYLKPLDGWTIPIWIAGCVWLLFGGKVLRWSLASIVFLLFMIPIPFSAETWLSVPLQSIATKLSSASLLMLGQPALAEGNTIWIGDHQLFIEEACSGLRIFVGIFALAFAFVLFSRWTWWQKGLAIIAALPIAIAANTARIVATGMLYEMLSGEAAKKFSHDMSGLFAIPLAALMFWMFLVFLDRLFPQVESLTAFEVSVPKTGSMSATANQ